MKKKDFIMSLIAIVMAAAMSVSLSSCFLFGGDDDEPDPELKVSPSTEQTIKGEGGTANSITFTVTSNLNWQVSSSQGWLTVSPVEGSDNGSIIATASSNGTGETRIATLTFSSKDGKAEPVTVNVSQKPGEITVTPSSASMLSDKGSTTSLTVTSTGTWNLSGCPDWIHASATSGSGSTTIVLTALSENWSDESREAALNFSGNGVSAQATVSQFPSLPPGLRVELSNVTIMADGFAGDLKFGPNAKGYREAFFLESDLATLTDRDIFNKLMTMTEYSQKADFAFSSSVNPKTKLVYCVAAYGNESNSDGSHKYGPITIEHITTRATTIEDDMYLTGSYNSSRWTVTAQRSGSYGQRCDDYYYLAAEEDMAKEFFMYYMLTSDAALAHLYMKPEIERDRNWGYKSGPQPMYFQRSGDVFFCTTWGVDRDTKQFSAELSLPVVYDLSSSSSREMKKRKADSGEWNKLHRHLTKKAIEQKRQSVRVFKLEK